MSKVKTEKQLEFRRRVLEDLKPRLQWYNDCINIKIEFKTKDSFHLHVIEDYITHLHVHGELTEYGVSIFRTSTSTTQDVYNETMDFLNDY